MRFARADMLGRHCSSRGGKDAVRDRGNLAVTKIVLVALTIAMLAPGTAQGAVVVVPPSATAGDEFSLPVLIDGTNHILTSVDEQPRQPADPFGSGAVAFEPADIAAKPASSMVRTRTIYGAADAAAQEPLPETTTWLMMILGFFGLSFAVRRRSSVSGDRVRFS